MVTLEGGVLPRREPPGADPHARWCGDWGLNTPGYPIGSEFRNCRVHWDLSSSALHSLACSMQISWTSSRANSETFSLYSDWSPSTTGSITYRIALGSHQGRKVFTLQSLPATHEPFDDLVGKVAGFSLHAGVAARAGERHKLERLCRTIARPAVSEKPLSLTANGNVRYQLKTPYRDGTTHVIFEPLDFIARLAALVPKPRVNLIRFHGVFAPNSAHRARVTPARRGRGNKPKATDKGQEQTPAERRASMTWAQRLKRVFNIDIESCKACGGRVQITACIEAPVVIEQILTHLERKQAATAASRLPPCRAPPQARLFD